MDTKRFSYSRQLRLLESHQFNTVFNKGRRIKGEGFTVIFVANQLQHPRLGFVIAKKQIKTAVMRNRIRRVVRENFRLQQHQLANIDMVFIAYKQISHRLPSLGDELSRKWPKKPTSNAKTISVLD